MAEVRTCSGCKKPSVVVMKTWGTSGMFASTDRVSRTDYRCQACGRQFRVLPWHVVRTIVGGLLSIQMGVLAGILGMSGLAVLFENPGLGLALGIPGALGIGLMGLAFHWSVSSSWNLLRNPLAPGAEVPELRYGEVPDLRQCGCGEAAPATGSVAHTHNGIPTGTETTYQCHACGEQFIINDVWGLIFLVLCSGVVLPIGLMLAPSAWDSPDFISVGATLVFGGAGVATVLIAMNGAVSRWTRHPSVETTS